MMSSVFVKSYTAPPVNKKEVLRYAGGADMTEDISSVIDECITEAEQILSYKVCYGIFENTGESASVALNKNLYGCSKVIVFAATLGLQLDRLILKYSRVAPSRALILQAYGAERIESLCDMFCEDMKTELGVELRPRFSPGYGDLSLDVQRHIFRVLDCPRKIGLTLNESLLMSPTKSVTAIVGIKDEY